MYMKKCLNMLYILITIVFFYDSNETMFEQGRMGRHRANGALNYFDDGGLKFCFHVGPTND